MSDPQEAYENNFFGLRPNPNYVITSNQVVDMKGTGTMLTKKTKFSAIEEEEDGIPVGK